MKHLRKHLSIECHPVAIGTVWDPSNPFYHPLLHYATLQGCDQKKNEKYKATDEAAVLVVGMKAGCENNHQLNQQPLFSAPF